VLADLLQQDGVVGWVADRGHATEVARSSTQQREAPGVDHLDRLVDGYHPLAHLRGEGTDAHDHDVDRADAVLGEALEVLGHVATGEDAGIDLGVVRLDLAADQSGHVGQLGDRGHLNAGRGQHRPRTVGGIDLDPLVKQLARQIGDTRAIRDREQGSHSAFSSLVAA